MAASHAARADAEAGVSRRWPWVRLLRRVFGFEVLVCDRCGGSRRILDTVTEPHAVRRLLAALGLAAEPPARARRPGRLIRRRFERPERVSPSKALHNGPLPEWCVSDRGGLT